MYSVLDRQANRLDASLKLKTRELKDLQCKVNILEAEKRMADDKIAEYENRTDSTSLAMIVAEQKSSIESLNQQLQVEQQLRRAAEGLLLRQQDAQTTINDQAKVINDLREQLDAASTAADSNTEYIAKLRVRHNQAQQMELRRAQFLADLSASLSGMQSSPKDLHVKIAACLESLQDPDTCNWKAL
eukprot:TRINITY_DN14303_c0_g1_i1.p1 TRINITY_DN14303_c0_g1~~TRINITY_DN14303_c0_g1_i1.p1  ORF type:complete len:187 (-),score=37.11 TRINITY_DN14303_c0_g1_i1:400-960(-)